MEFEAIFADVRRTHSNTNFDVFDFGYGLLVQTEHIKILFNDMLNSRSVSMAISVLIPILFYI